MANILKKELPRILEVEEISPFGGFICPKCKAAILTKAGYILIPGYVDCQFCLTPLHISQRICTSANEARKLFALTTAFLGLGFNK